MKHRGPIAATAFLLLFVLYSAWMTGGSFVFSECKPWPNYNMLAKSFAKGQLNLDSKIKEDAVEFNGRSYMYSGPVPALFRVPFTAFIDTTIPTGLMVAFFCAGVGTLFILMLPLLTEPDQKATAGPILLLFAAIMVMNGITLFMTAIPSFHHEAIASGMFFLSASIYLFLRIKSHSFHSTWFEAALFGLSCAFCSGSRLSYALSIALLACLFTAGTFRNWESNKKSETIISLGVFSAIVIAACGLLLLYNYLRFGSFLESGMRYQASQFFGHYFLEGNYFRYEHLPYNLWTFFCRIPEFIPQFPFYSLPLYTVEVNSYQFQPYNLIYKNELSISMFLLMPLLFLLLLPIVHRVFSHERLPLGNYGLLFSIFLLQIIPVSFTVASTARYYYDFLPVALALAYLGALQLRKYGPVTLWLIYLLGFLSILFSLTLPIHGVEFYRQLISYESPLRGILVRILQN